MGTCVYDSELGPCIIPNGWASVAIFDKYIQFVNLSPMVMLIFSGIAIYTVIS
ncbi:hypothetical protein M426DRAFT_197781 [Hypoxylon sp. CI-4A]|nr:hypothetical protein M426DRAFT_197781 [Hypoxylon sp. CI-4A]